jgi:hypothetical protein
MDLMEGNDPGVDRTRVEQRSLDELSDLGAVWELLIAVPRPTTKTPEKKI